MTFYFTSDTHFGHANILKYCNRPWSTVDEMNEALVTRWNERVKPEDTVYHLGDFAMGGRQNIQFRKHLNGRVILIRGNHDRPAKIMQEEGGFDEVHNSMQLELEGHRLYLAHIPVHLPAHLDERTHDPRLTRSPPTTYDYFLCGHVHEKWKRIGNTINVGSDVSNFYPLTLQELLTRDSI